MEPPDHPLLERDALVVAPFRRDTAQNMMFLNSLRLSGLRRLRFIWPCLALFGFSCADLAAQVRFSGNFAYSGVGNAVTFGVTRIDNFRPLGTVSGTLAIQLWATTVPYAGVSTLIGNKIAEVQIGTLLGGYYLSPVTRTTFLSNLPAPGYYNIVFVLAEWSGFQWLTVDHGNFPTYQPIGVVAIAPTITSQPRSLELSVGGSGSLSVAASGTEPFSLQWYRNGVVLAGKTASSLVLSNAQLSDAGAYSVVVTNSAGSVASSAATVTVTQPVQVQPPVITTQPASQSAPEGSSVLFSVVASSTVAVQYVWTRNGAAINGATSSSLTLSNVSRADEGAYVVRVTNSVGSVNSTAATLSVITATQVQPPVITSQPVSQSATEGSFVKLSVIVTSTTPLQYSWSRNGIQISGATDSSLSFSSVRKADEGVYGVRVTNSAGVVMSSQASVTVLPSSSLSNLSVRTTLAAGQVLTLGAVVSGGSKDVLVRAAGPVLAKFGLTGMADPRLDLFTGGSAPKASNDDWNPGLSTTFATVGAFGFDSGSKDAALRESLNGAFTVQAKGAGPGTVLVEAYDVSGGTGRRLVNVSARNQVGTGDDILIAGFAISGTGSKKLLIRAVGPTLGAFGVEGALADPIVRVFDSRNTVVGSNDNWEASLATTFAQVGAFALASGSRDAALIIDLPASSSYTVQVSGASGGTGEALVEVYEIP